MTEQTKTPCEQCGTPTAPTLLKGGVCNPCRLERRSAELSVAPDARPLDEQVEDAIKTHLATDLDLRFRAQIARASEPEAPRVNDRELTDPPGVAARKELANRVLASRHLLPFVQRMVPDYQPGWVHKDICLRLEKFSDDVVNKRSPRLMIFMPPRSGKSELASRSFPAWHLGRNPHHEIMACSYSGALAMAFSRKVRGFIRDEDYSVVFPDCQLDPDSQASEHWSTTRGGGYVAAGVGGAITGKGAHILCIDDPVKNREDAESATSREAVWDWYTSTAYTRLAPGGGVLVILTRWHDSDLAGRLLAQAAKGEGDQWEVVKYPAIAEQDEPFRKKGDALHPARYPLEALERIRAAVGPRDWSALYQQNPVAEDGDLFTRDMIRYYRDNERPPLERFKVYAAWDLAIGKKEQNDWTVGLIVGVAEDDSIYVLDVRRGRWDALEIIDQMFDVYRTWTPDITGIEKSHIEMTLGPLINKRIQEEKLFRFHIEVLPTGRQDKIARSRPVQGRMKQGLVRFPVQAPWCQTLVNELLRFPNGSHDDQVDALSWIGQMLDKFTTYYERPVKKKSWRDRLKLSSQTTKNPMVA